MHLYRQSEQRFSSFRFPELSQPTWGPFYLSE
jgi:hypothetical protein